MAVVRSGRAEEKERQRKRLGTTLPTGVGPLKKLARGEGEQVVPPWRRRVVARRTSPVDFVPLKKARRGGEQATLTEPSELEEDGEDVSGEEEEASIVPFFCHKPQVGARRWFLMDAGSSKGKGKQVSLTFEEPDELEEEGEASDGQEEEPSIIPFFCRKSRVVARWRFPAGVGLLKKVRGREEQARDTVEEPCMLEEEGGGGGGCAGQEEAVSMISLCRRSLDAYELLNKVGEGTYGVVYKARDKETGEIVAVKKVDIQDAVTLREISILASLRHHPCIVGLKEVVSASSDGEKDSVFLVMEYAEYDLNRLIQEMQGPFSEREAKFFMLRLLLGIRYIHDSGVLHRDLKASNLLVNRHGELKVCDFGLSRRCLSGGVAVERPYTNWVGTHGYRAPELLLKAKEYSAAVDMWSAGCIMAKLIAGAPLFAAGSGELDQLYQIFGVLGTPDKESWPSFRTLCADLGVGFPEQQPCGDLREKLSPSLSEDGFNFLMGLLKCNPRRRMTAEEALNHEWFREFQC